MHALFFPLIVNLALAGSRPSLPVTTEDQLPIGLPAPEPLGDFTADILAPGANVFVPVLDALKEVPSITVICPTVDGTEVHLMIQQPVDLQRRTRRWTLRRTQDVDAPFAALIVPRVPGDNIAGACYLMKRGGDVVGFTFTLHVLPPFDNPIDAARIMVNNTLRLRQIPDE